MKHVLEIQNVSKTQTRARVAEQTQNWRTIVPQGAREYMVGG